MATTHKYAQLPALPDEITAEWMGSVLKQKVKALTMTGSIFGTGSKLFYSIEHEEDAASLRPAHVCVKGVFDPQLAAALPWTILLAQREARFFAEIAPLIKHMGYPEGWWSGTSETQGIAIMSKLLKQGCTFPEEAASFQSGKAVALAHEWEVLDHYLAALHRLGGPKLDRKNDDDDDEDELLIEYKRSCLTSVIWIICPPGIQSKARVDALCEGSVASWVDHESIQTIEAQ